MATQNVFTIDQLKPLLDGVKKGKGRDQELVDHLIEFLESGLSNEITLTFDDWLTLKKLQK